MNPTKRSPVIHISIILAILVLIGGGIYFFITRSTTPVVTSTNTTDNSFTPFGRIPPASTTTKVTNQQPSNNSQNTTQAPIPTLRLLSNTPIGGYGASTTASTTVVRWVDRGRGNIYEVHEDSNGIATISNTVVPMISASIWNKNLTAFIGPSLTSGTSDASILYAELLARIIPKAASTTISTSSSLLASSTVAQTPYELKGKNLPDHIITYAASPKRDKIFFLVNNGGSSVGYIATFDGKSVTQIFSTPVTQINAEWPEDNTIAITTKGSAAYAGFLYFVNPKTGVWKKILGPILGLSTKVSTDAKYVLASSAQGSSVSTAIYEVKTQKYTDAIFGTLADKCVWGNFNQNMVYCAVPSQPVSGTYPDDWYRGTLSTVDVIWQINATTAEIHMVTSIVDQSDRVIDAFNLGLDPKDEYLFFMNKNDLSLWSFDLVASKVQ